MKLPNQMKYQMEKKGMNSLKKKSLKKKGKSVEKPMKEADSMAKPMPAMMKMKKMNKGGKC